MGSKQRIIQWNCRGIRPRYEELLLLLTLLSNKGTVRRCLDDRLLFFLFLLLLIKDYIIDKDPLKNVSQRFSTIHKRCSNYTLAFSNRYFVYDVMLRKRTKNAHHTI